MALHSELTGDDLHDVKGVDLATEGQVLSADGAGASTFVSPSTLINVELGDEASGYSTSAQVPGTLGTAIVLDFDTVSSSTDVTVDAAGTFTFNTDGIYYVVWTAYLGRSGGAATSYIGYRLQLNGVQFGQTKGLTTATSTIFIPTDFSFLHYFEAGDVLRAQIIQDSLGDASGGVGSPNLTDWDDIPSVQASAWRIVGS